MTSRPRRRGFSPRRLPLRLNVVWLALALAAPLSAQTGVLSPRENYERALALFGQGYVFSADELQSLDTLRTKLADAGDADLAAEVAVLRLAALTHSGHAAAEADAQNNLAADSLARSDTAAKARDREAWKATRDIGLAVFSAATVTTLLLAVIGSQEEALLRNSVYSDFETKNRLNRAIETAAIGSAGVMFLSLFPLLIGQSNL